MRPSRRTRHALLLACAVPAVPAMIAGCATAPTAAQSTTGQPSTGRQAPQVLSVGAQRVTPAPAARAGGDLSSFGGRVFLADAGISPTSNAAISPYSIYSALAMTRAGAKGETGAQLDRALGGSAKVQGADVTAIDTAVAAAVSAARRESGAKAPQMVVTNANSIWSDRSLPVRKTYLTSLAAGFGAGVHTVDFRHDPAGARGQINGWVKDRTNQLIPQLLGPSAVSSQTRIELVNAIYLKARWAERMTVSSRPHVFTTADGKTQQVTVMTDRSPMSLGAGHGWRSVTIPYTAGGLAMTIVLPEKGRYDAVRRQLPSVLSDATRGTTSTQVQLTLPKFSTNTHTNLVPALTTMGVRALFGRADLSGIAGPPGELKVSSVIHQSVVKVDEFGTQAAAATAVGVAPGAVRQSQPVSFVVDRAFFFVIHDTTTGAPLFLGQVANPA
ncbi:serpin family protein [Leekyejoonella antrihumi]|uniref:Serpin family protein n=1 Tax=Leekyejoonella antrihumi TaxID=1660198 RepID=A0A563DZB6_9MICO|nr:serpin family protein [Leekyejoonella antrihumi]TWP35577.1 serpin family protein [Leekyejoonella antrihumi]